MHCPTFLKQLSLNFSCFQRARTPIHVDPPKILIPETAPERFYTIHSSGVQRKQFRGGGVQGRGSGLVGGPGGGGPLAAGECSKICKKFLKKIAKNVVFSPSLQRNFKTMR